MTDQHPITPPPDLLKEWIDAWFGAKVKHENMTEFFATRAARWGADKELEACVEWLLLNGWGQDINRLRAARRPKPPSLKEQALKALQDQIDTAFMLSPDAEERADLIRRALEQLDD